MFLRTGNLSLATSSEELYVLGRWFEEAGCRPSSGVTSLLRYDLMTNLTSAPVGCNVSFGSALRVLPGWRMVVQPEAPHYDVRGTGHASVNDYSKQGEAPSNTVRLITAGDIQIIVAATNRLN